MPRTLTLRRRMQGRWLDDVVLGNAIESLAKGKTMTKAALWLSISAKIQLAKEAQPDGEAYPFDVELSNKEARVLWKNLVKQPLESFGRSQDGKDAMPPILQLSQMLNEFAEQLGEKMPVEDGSEDEEPEGEVE